jgi:hypothetical protein
VKPTLHITNWSSRKLHGPGRKLTIMARPRSWEHGEGKVASCTPAAAWLHSVRSGEISVDDYRRRIEGQLGVYNLSPGSLVVVNDGLPVRDGDTLCCACSREEAAAGRCHRVWVAQALVRAGWRVVLDGVELEVVDGR